MTNLPSCSGCLFCLLSPYCQPLAANFLGHQGVMSLINIRALTFLHMGTTVKKGRWEVTCATKTGNMFTIVFLIYPALCMAHRELCEYCMNQWVNGRINEQVCTVVHCLICEYCIGINSWGYNRLTEVILYLEKFLFLFFFSLKQQVALEGYCGKGPGVGIPARVATWPERKFVLKRGSLSSDVAQLWGQKGPWIG